MEYERINEDTILLRIENQDLVDRGTSMGELLSNPKEIEGFFHGILSELQVLEEFEDSEGMSFQIMPSPEGIELYVTKILQAPEDDDSRFLQNLLDSLQHSLASRRGPGTKKTPVKQAKASQKKDASQAEAVQPEPLDCTIVFEDIENFIELAKKYPYPVEESTLYYYSNHYFLHVYQPLSPKTDPSADIALLREFGEFSRISWEVLQEYGQIVLDKQALEKAKTHF